MIKEKQFKIFIVDELYAGCLAVERTLNGLGYWRIAPLHSFRELCLLISQKFSPVDFLIINCRIVRDVDVRSFCRCNPQIRHALLYNGFESELTLLGEASVKVLYVSLERELSSESVMNMLSLINEVGSKPMGDRFVERLLCDKFVV